MTESARTEFISIEFWEQTSPDSDWRHRSVAQTRFYINGLLTEPFDVEKIYDDAYAVSASPALGAVKKPRPPFAEVLANAGVNSVCDPS